MEKRFEEIVAIEDDKMYDEMNRYLSHLIDDATNSGMLQDSEADNAFTREIGRIGNLCADFESVHMKFDTLKFKSPLVVSIEKEMEKRHLKQRQTAALLDVKESTFSQIMTGKRAVSMRMAKKLYAQFNIDPRIILEFA